MINEIIKKKEIVKIFNFEDENLFVEQYLKDLYIKLDINNERILKKCFPNMKTTH